MMGFAVAQPILRTRLKILPVDLPVPETAISLVALKDRTLSPVAQLFVDWTHEFTKSLAPRWPDRTLLLRGLLARGAARGGSLELSDPSLAAFFNFGRPFLPLRL